MVLENENQAMDEAVINPMDEAVINPLDVIPPHEAEDSDSASSNESFVFSVSTENLSDLEDCEVLDMDSPEAENKIMKVDDVNNVRFLSYESGQTVCMTKYYYVIDNESLCPSCFFETVSGVPSYVPAVHITEHSSRKADNLIACTCFCCNMNLYIYCLCKYCIICNNINLQQ
uniref:Uncharacterized protein LOC114348984 n=1 Tax=Diabrotica virgifera virgifera TaxID=50390 RepID=A0A6P7HC79_DIAVI